MGARFPFLCQKLSASPRGGKGEKSAKTKEKPGEKKAVTFENPSKVDYRIVLKKGNEHSENKRKKDRGWPSRQRSEGKCRCSINLEGNVKSSMKTGLNRKEVFERLPIHLRKIQNLSFRKE